MYKRFLSVVPASLLAVGAAGLCLSAPTTSADPGQQQAPDPNAPSCAALHKVQPAIDDLRAKAGSYLTPTSQSEDDQQKSAPSTPTKAPSSKPAKSAPSTPAKSAPSTPANQNDAKIQGIVDSLHKISGDLKSAEPGISDAPLHDSADKLATAVNATADYVASFRTSPEALNPAKMASLGVQITGGTIIYQMNYNRVCGQVPDDQQAAPSAQAAPTPAAPRPATPKTTPKPSTPAPTAH